MFGWDEVNAWSRFRSLIKICVWTCDMNSTLGSVVPLAMLFLHVLPVDYIDLCFLHVIPVDSCSLLLPLFSTCSTYWLLLTTFAFAFYMFYLWLHWPLFSTYHTCWLLFTTFAFVFDISYLLTPVHYICLCFLHVLTVDCIYLCFRHIIPVDSSSSRFSSTTSILQSPIVDSLSLHLQTRNEKKNKVPDWL